MIEAGNCIWLETNIDKNGFQVGHLFIVLLNPEEHTKNTIIVPVDTLRSEKQDKTTILDSCDHEFITHRSFINYSRARIRSVTFIEQMIKDGKAKTKTPIDTKILEKVKEGIKKSIHTPQEVVDMYSYYMMRNLTKK